MHQIPRSALILGLAGVLPFAWGALTLLWDGLAQWGLQTLGPRFVGPYVQLFYGAVILSFMSGVLWGFATRAEGDRAALGYGLSVIPALWAFFTTGGGPDSAGLSLIAGFVGLLALDWQFWRWRLAPRWWLALRLLLTALVVLCLGIGVLI
ncbi:DUF3429 domain-containing protein [Pseudoponticoccus marisrubri]|uniref:DUF3429 domain-containing protein n=1 Tax=Pseudoponticoccus marisrubri TaxID=1685382 RepID=A0A0W7WKC9_9RHOB|nr:DUF3429 domain-containing protein [Pseudoponticoccus marisrubri]KUF11035.1 hypothetical protein AVJ23_08230 [Pseudoponticoccus marisrubri]